MLIVLWNGINLLTVKYNLQTSEIEPGLGCPISVASYACGNIHFRFLSVYGLGVADFKSPEVK